MKRFLTCSTVLFCLFSAIPAVGSGVSILRGRDPLTMSFGECIKQTADNLIVFQQDCTTTRFTFDLSSSPQFQLPDGIVGTPSLTFVSDTNTGLYWIGADNLGISLGGTKIVDLARTAISFTQVIATSGSPTFLTFTGGAHTTLTASTEAIDANFNFARTVQYATGAQTLLRSVVFQPPTIAFVGASTVTEAATVDITGPPVAGTNATLTDTWAFRSTGRNVMQQNTTYAAPLAVKTLDAASGRMGIEFQISTGSVLWTAGSGLGNYDFTFQNGGMNGGTVRLTLVRDTADIILGRDTSATPIAATVRATNASGTDIAGANLTIIASRGTGTGLAGDVLIQGSPVLASGSTLQTATTWLKIKGNSGHQHTMGTAPTVGGSCGTGPTIAGTDLAGKVTTGTVAPTSCTVTFAKAWLNAPACTVTNETTANLARATSTTTTVVLAGTMVASDVLAYSCQGYE